MISTLLRCRRTVSHDAAVPAGGCGLLHRRRKYSVGARPHMHILGIGQHEETLYLVTDLLDKSVKHPTLASGDPVTRSAWTLPSAFMTSCPATHAPIAGVAAAVERRRSKKVRFFGSERSDGLLHVPCMMSAPSADDRRLTTGGTHPARIRRLNDRSRDSTLIRPLDAAQRSLVRSNPTRPAHRTANETTRCFVQGAWHGTADAPHGAPAVRVADQDDIVPPIGVAVIFRIRGGTMLEFQRTLL